MRERSSKVALEVKRRKTGSEVKLIWRGIRWSSLLRSRWLVLLLTAWLAFGVTSGLAATHRVPELERCVEPKLATLAHDALEGVTPLDRTIIFLSGVKHLPNDRIAKIVGFADPETVGRHLAKTAEKIAGNLSTIFGNAVIDAPDELLFLMPCIGAALEPMQTTMGDELSMILNPSTKVGAIGQGAWLSDGNYSGLVLYTTVAPGKSLKVTKPFVLRPTDFDLRNEDTAQRMLVTGAYYAGTTQNGDSLYLLEAYCMDHDHAPPDEDTEYTSNPLDQGLLADDTIANIMRSGQTDNDRQDLFDDARSQLH